MTAAAYGRLRTRRAPVAFSYIRRRLIEAAAAVLAVISAVFVLLHLTGNPALVVAPPDSTPQEIERIAAAYGFNQPIIEQFFEFFGKVFTGHFPDSVTYGVPAIQVVLGAIGPTMLLAGTAFVLGNAIGLIIGYLAAESRWRPLRNVPLLVSLVGLSVPPFYLGIVAVLIFGVRLGWFPTSGYGSISDLILPLAVLTASVVPNVTRIYRAQILEVRNEDYVATAVAKGIHPVLVRFRHIALNALGPAVTLMGLQLGALTGGVVTIEVIFSWPGMGQVLVNAIEGEDYPVALAGVLVLAIGFVIASLLADIAAALVDPLGHRAR